jgi:hypothetical protein
MQIIGGLIVMLLAGFFINGCENSGKEPATANKSPQNSPNKASAEDTLKTPSGKNFKYFNKTYPVPEGMHAWEAQLNKLYDDERFEKSGLELSGYRYMRDIETKDQLEALKDTVLNDFRYIPSYGESSGRFMIHETKKSKESIRLFLDGIMPTSEQQKAMLNVSKDGSPVSDAVYLFKKGDAGLIKLEWDYREEKLNTLCIVSKRQGIIYDNLLYFINFAPKSIKDVIKEADIQPQQPPLSSPNSVIHLGTPTYYSAHFENENYNPFGIKIWYYKIQITASGYKSLDDHQSIVDRSMVAKSGSSWGFDSFAKFCTISFEPGESGHWQFAWSYGYRLNPVSWQESDSSNLGGGTKVSGERYVGADKLLPLNKKE